MAAPRFRWAIRLIAIGALLTALDGPAPAGQEAGGAEPPVGEEAGGAAAPAGQEASGAEPPADQDEAPVVHVADVDALIHPASAEFVIGALEAADAARADLVVLVLRTPGGLVDSTRDINTAIIESRVPVAVFVGPSGARAASAGFLITIAADVAAMAPGTHVGAAHPVAGTGQPMDDAASEKAASDVAAYARSLAARRGRNVELAEEAVVDSRSFTEEEALRAEPPLIDLVVDDVDALVAALDGRAIARWNGQEEVLRTAGARVEHVEMTWRQRLLSTIAHPQIAVLLFSLGSLGLTIELWSPGAILPGVVGGLCLLLAFFAFQILPVNYVGLLLLLFGLVLLILEMLTPTFGALAAGGLVSMVFGAVMLIDSPLPELQPGWPFVLSLMTALAVLTVLLGRLAVRAHLRPPVTGAAGMVGERGEVIESIAPGARGRVATHGEIWSAAAREPIPRGARVQVDAIDGMTLTVSPERPAGGVGEGIQ